MRLTEAFFDFRPSPAFFAWKLTRHAILLEMDLPDNLPFFFGRQVEEEGSQCEAPAQFRGKTCDRIAPGDEEHMSWETASMILSAVRSRSTEAHTEELYMAVRSKAMVGMPALLPVAFAMADFAAPCGPVSTLPSASRSCM